ncbi:hypothetical protein GOP47_0029592, partial [Adiantum capillus-veneris]
MPTKRAQGYHRDPCWRKCIGQIDLTFTHEPLWSDRWCSCVNEQDDASAFLPLLRACAKNKDLSRGTAVHEQILERGLLEKCLNALVSMYASCGALAKAQELFDAYAIRDIVTWTVLIAAYAREGQGKDALTCFDKMQQQGLSPNAVTFACALKACGSIGAFDQGEQIHDEIAKKGLLESNVKLGTALLGMYAKCGSLTKARQVLEELPFRDVISWNTLIAGYVEQAKSEQALICFEQMKHEGLSPDAVTFACILKACGSTVALEKGEEIHEEINHQGLLGRDIVLGNALVDMYAKCGALKKAQQVLKSLPVQNIISWNALMSGYVEHCEDEQALSCFAQMQWEGLPPDAVTFSCALKACGSIGAADRGEKLHREIAKLGHLRDHIKLGTALVDMYVKCGALKKAREVLEELPSRNVISWNVLVAGYTQHGRGEEALHCFQQMQQEGLPPDAVTFACILKACGRIGRPSSAEQIHAAIANQGLLETHAMLGNALVSMYAKCGAISKAQQVLEELPARDAMSWHALIAGYVDHGRWEQALSSFERMHCECFLPNVVTFLYTLKACTSVCAMDEGERVHNEIATQGLLKNNIELSNALVDMYAKCGALAKAQEVFDQIPIPDITSWNALIAGYAEHGEFELALRRFEKLEHDGLSPDAVTFTCILKVCGSIGALDKGVKVHYRVAQLGLLKGNTKLGNALVGMYAKCGNLSKAHKVLEDLSIRDVISWNVLIAGCTAHGEGEQALNCFEKMQSEGISPDEVTFACILKACGIVGAIVKGGKIHDEIAKQGLLKDNFVLGTALLDMYAKCCSLAKAQQGLAQLPVRDVISWNALMAGSIQQGEGAQSLKCFYQLQHEGLSPNASTFSCVLNACSRLGLVDKAIILFEDMHAKYGLKPEFEHFACMVDVFGRAGLLNEAFVVIEKMPSAQKGLWSALLGACWAWVDVNVGRWAFDHALEVDRNNAASYTLMANIYSAAHKQGTTWNFVQMVGQGRCIGKSEHINILARGDAEYTQCKDLYLNLALNKVGYDSCKPLPLKNTLQTVHRCQKFFVCHGHHTTTSSISNQGKWKYLDDHVGSHLLSSYKSFEATVKRRSSRVLTNQLKIFNWLSFRKKK